VFAQLRDVLAAEDSTVMPQKNDHSRTLGPKRSQAHAVAINIRQRNARKLAAEGFSHGRHSPAEAGVCQAKKHSPFSIQHSALRHSAFSPLHSIET
jgi:hypothetical protein